MNGKLRTIGRLLRDPRWATLTAASVGLVVLLAVLVIVNAGGGSQAPAAPEPKDFTISPQGDDVPRLTPIQVTFKQAPSERNGAKLVNLEPAATGSYVWVSDRTLLFQPDFPGLLRGQEYAVKVAARPEAGLPAAQQAKFTTTGLLTVQNVIPAPDDTDVPSNVQVLIQFSRSVAPLTLLSAATTPAPVVFDPPITGKGEWLNTSLYRLVPDALAPNTKYTARIPAGLTSAADGVLKEDFSWSFTSYGPALDSVSPDANTTFAAPRQPITLKFNQAMDRASVQDGFALTTGGSAKVAGTFAWSDGDRTVVFTPAADLARAGTYAIALEKARKGAGGGETKAPWSSNFTVVGLPGVASTRPENGATNGGRYGVGVTFKTPMNEDSLEGKVSISGIAADAITTYWYQEGLNLNINTSLHASTAYTVTIAAGGVDRYGQPLAAYSFSFKTGALPSGVSFAIPGTVSTFSASTAPILYYHATNVATVSFSLYRLTAEEAYDIIANNYLPQNPGPTPWVPSTPAIRTWTETNDATKDQVMLLSTSLSGSTAPLPKGDYFVKSDNGFYNSRFAFSVVDTAIITKLSSDELLAWVIDHDTGKPLANARVKVNRGDIGDQVSDANGLVRFPIASTVGVFPPRQRTFIVTVDDAGHRGVTSTWWQQGTYPYQLNIPVEYYPRKYVANLYTERPIYRPGEEVFYKGVIREDDDASYSVPASVSNMDFHIIDANGKDLATVPVQLNEFGTFAGSFTIPADAAVGDYGAFIQWNPAPQFQMPLTGTSFLVAEFKKPEFQVEVATGKPVYSNGDTIDASATGSFYFGGALAGAKVTWAAMANPYTMTVKGYERYSFADYDYARTAVVRDPLRATGTATTGPGGVAAFSVPAALKGNEGAQQFTISATITDENAQAVASSTNVTVHAGDLYAGIQPADYVAQAGKDARINLVSVDTTGAIQPNKPVTVQVYERKWVTTKEQTPEGARRYRSDPVDTLLTTLTTTTDSKGEGFATYAPAGSGTIRLVAEITDTKGRTTRSAAYLWVWGEGFASWRVSNDDTVQLVADKEKYNVGDTAEILVPAPFENATGLVTVERGKIITRSVQDFPTNSTRIRVPITDRSVPNVFVSVVLYRPPTLVDPVPRFKVGYVELPVSTDTRALKVDITPDRAQAKPGDKVKYDIKVTDSAGKGVKAELSVAVVDKAVLSLADERGVDGLKAFWFERGLGVLTASSMSVSINRSNDVISEAPAGGKGGGGLGEDRLRQDFRNTAFWQAQVVTNADGTATFVVPMPDNLTTWRLQARAVSGDTLVGEGTNELVSTQPLLIRPALPRFLRVGDKATLRTLVRNATGTASDVTVTLAAEGVDVSGDTTKKATIAPGTSATFEWPATVSAEGVAKLTFAAKGSGGLSDAVVQELPIYLDVTPETVATGGVVTTEPLSEAIFLPAFAILKRGLLALTLQPTLTGSMASELTSFRPPPPQYSEDSQSIASRIIAVTGVMQAQKGVGDPNNVLYASRLGSDVATLVGRQRQDGGWAWCQGTLCESDPQLTANVLLALGEAKDRGIGVDAGAVSRAGNYIVAYINRTVDVVNPADPSDKALMLYAAASAGSTFTYQSTMRALQEQYRAKLTNWGRAYLLLGLAETGATKDDPQVGQLLNDLASNVLPSANGNHWEDERTQRSFFSGTRTTALVLQALVAVDPQHPLIEETVRWLMVARGAGGWRTGVEQAQAILALSEFAANTGELAGNFSYEAQLGGSKLLAGTFSPGSGTKGDSKQVSLEDLGAGKVTVLQLARDFASPGRLYYTLNLKYLTPAKDIEALNRGFAVSHEYSLLDAPGKPITSAKLGDTVRVKVTVIAPADRNYVVADDYLPAGLEPIDPALKIIDPKLKSQLDLERQQAQRPAELDYYAPWFRWYYSPWQQTEPRDDRVTLRASTLRKGVYEFIYYARATSPGDYFVAPARIEESYFPEVFGRSDSGRFTVAP
ncbi:MAG: Ig-like domain-containing protein [Chloroflexi bacterium]|nr:Ig-like domain-containing protein [Chloroflexota bacterium]